MIRRQQTAELYTSLFKNKKKISNPHNYEIVGRILQIKIALSKKKKRPNHPI